MASEMSTGGGVRCYNTEFGGNRHVMALKEDWQDNQNHRRQAVAERQQQVRATVDSWQQERHIQAQTLQRERRAFVSQLKQQNRDFLAETNDTRHQKAEQLAGELHEFARSLSRETAEFLTLSADDRTARALQSAQDLQAFRDQLRATVEQLQREWDELGQERIYERDQRRDRVQGDLQELNLIRETVAQQLQEQLQTARAQREADVHTLFQELGQFRAELQDYRQSLEQYVWGNAPAKPTPAATASPKTRDIAPPASVPKATKTTPAPTPQKLAPVGIPAKTLQRPAPPAATAAHSPNPEGLIDDYIRQREGVRLSDIEAELNLNRIQTVDALRSLLKQGRITQRDRTYYAGS
ncbi:MAG: gas vesicle protein GvpC [Limnospira sp.]